METDAKKALILDLSQKTAEVKSFPDLKKYIGGVGLGLRLLELYKNTDPVVFSVGPLNGFFPYVSKTSVVLSDGGVVEDLYLGGNLSLRIRFCCIDSIVICNSFDTESFIDITNTSTAFVNSEVDISSLGLPGKKSALSFEDGTFLLGNYFKAPESFLDTIMKKKKVKGMCITGTETFKPKNFAIYEKLYDGILSRKSELSVEKGIYPSCAGCPMGCGKSKTGEIGGNIFLHSLVACQYADKIYSDIGIVFSCLNSLGYDYTHEDLENLPRLVEDTLKNLN
jgi:hypothetical protein